MDNYSQRIPSAFERNLIQNERRGGNADYFCDTIKKDKPVDSGVKRMTNDDRLQRQSVETGKTFV